MRVLDVRIKIPLIVWCIGCGSAWKSFTVARHPGSRFQSKFAVSFVMTSRWVEVTRKLQSINITLTRQHPPDNFSYSSALPQVSDSSLRASTWQKEKWNKKEKLSIEANTFWTSLRFMFLNLVFLLFHFSPFLIFVHCLGKLSQQKEKLLAKD